IPLLYAYAMNGRVRLPQLALAVYFAGGVLLHQRTLDTLLRAPAILLRARRSTPARGVVDFICGAIRIGLLLALGLPYVIAAALTYRPKLVTGAEPARALGCAFEPISFITADRYRIAAWWI